MRIVFSNHFCGFPKYGKSSRTFSVARELVALGHDVSIVTASHSHSRTTQPDVSGPLTVEKMSGVRVIYLKTPSYTPGNMLSRLRNLLGFLARYQMNVGKIRQMTSPDVVIEGVAYTLPIIMSASLARKSKASLVYEVRDLWPLTLYEMGFSRKNPLAWLIGQVQKWTIARADAVVSSLRFANSYFEETSRKPKRFAYIPSAADQALFAERAPLSTEVAERLSAIRNDYSGIVGYAGSIGMANSVDMLIEAGRDLVIDNIAIVIFGEGARKAELMTQVEQTGQSNVFFFDPVPKVQVFDAISSFDLGLVGGRAKYIHQYGVSPNKVYDYMICGVPALFALHTEDNIVADNDCGISLMNPSHDTLVEAIRGFFALSPSRRDEMGQNGTAAVARRFSYDTVGWEYSDFLAELCDPKSDGPS